MTNEKRKSKLNQRKIDTVTALKEKLSRAKAVFVTDYRGLTHKQLEDLRKSLKKAEAEYLIVKNTLLKKTLEASDNKNKEGLYDSLKQPTAALFAYGDQISAVKALADFAKINIMPKVKAGLFENDLISTDDFKRLASLPSKEILLATLAFRMKSPIYGLHYALNWNLQRFVIALNNIKGKKPSN